jgi:membrane protease YdiL (CAAX protease family)
MSATEIQVETAAEPRVEDITSRGLDSRSENVVLTFVALLALTAVLAGVGLGPLLQGSLIDTLSPSRTAGWAALLAAGVAGVWAILVVWRGRLPESIGLARVSLRPSSLALGTLAGVATVVVAVELATIGGLRIGTGPAPYHPAFWRLGVGVVAFFLSCAVQDVVFLCGLVACLAARLRRWQAVGIVTALFLALHLGQPNATIVSSAVTGVFFVVLAALFYWSGRYPSLAAPVGFHTAWNICIPLVFGLPLTGHASAWALIPHHGGDQLWLGGTYGAENGLGGLIALLLVLTALYVVRRIRPSLRDEKE